MSDKKFTPGPWQKELGQESAWIRDFKGRAVGRAVGSNVGERMANAHLFAAAPELLEALEGLSWIFERTDDGWILRDALQISIKLNQAEAAILKAKRGL